MLTNTMRTRLWQGSLAQPFSVHKNISGERGIVYALCDQKRKNPIPGRKRSTKLYEKR